MENSIINNPYIIIKKPELYFRRNQDSSSYFISTVQTIFHEGYRLLLISGCDKRELNSQIQNEFLSYIRADPYANSFLMYNTQEVKSKILNWKSQLPWITPHYALKSNPIEPIVHDVINGPYGAFDCASKGEIQLVLKYGVRPDRIIYSNSVKNEKDIIYASKKGVKITTADSIDELLKLKQLAPEMKILWRLSITEENPEMMATLFSGKFGDDVSSLPMARQRFLEIQRLGINLHGLHFHCGSAIQGSDSFGKAIDLARECMAMGREIGHDMELLDVGGGFPAGNIHENALTALQKTQNDPFQVIAEPGRHFSANSCQLLFRIMTKRMKQGKLCYHVNESLYHSFNCILMDGVSFEGDQDQFYSALDQEGQKCQYTQGNAALFGMTCDGRDVIAENMRMPQDLKVGDWLCMSGMGAYTVGPKSNFNGMKSTSKVHKWSGVYEEERVLEGQLSRTLV